MIHFAAKTQFFLDWSIMKLKDNEKNFTLKSDVDFWRIIS